MSSVKSDLDNIQFNISEKSPTQQLDNSNTNEEPEYHNKDSDVFKPTFPDQVVAEDIRSKDTYAEDMEKNIIKMVEERNIKLAILTPCYGGVCNVNYMCSLINTISLMNQLKVKLRIEFCKNDSLVSRARNNLVAKALTDPETTHVLFIDNDITWNPVDIVKLLLADKDVVGGLYPVKTFYWERLINKDGVNVVQALLEHKKNTPLKDVDDVEYLQNRLLRYNVNYVSGNVEIKSNLMEVRHIATGFVMIKREVFDQMFKAYPQTKYVDDVNFLEKHENEFAYALFDCGVEEGHYFSEDWLFCSRWTKMGGKVYTDISINLTHTGPQDYVGSFVSTIV